MARLTANQNEANLVEASAALRAAATTRNSLASRKQDVENRIQSANAALAQLSLETLLAQANQSDQAKQETEADFMAAKSALEAAEQALTDANAAAESALNAKRDSESHMTRLQAEIDALQYLLADLGDHDAAPIADQLSVSDGMETALAGYLADELSAPVGSGNQAFWREGSKANMSPPEGTIPLANFVTGAPALAASLAGVGVVDDASIAEALQFSLLPGQAISTKSGSLWRWDGFVRHANQSDKGAERIRQRRRLDALQDDAAKAGQKLDQSGAIANSSETTLIAAREHLQSCRSASMQAEQAFGDSRRRAESDALKLAAGHDRAAELNTSLDELATSLANCEVEIAALADDAALGAGEAAARTAAGNEQMCGSTAVERPRLTAAVERPRLTHGRALSSRDSKGRIGQKSGSGWIGVRCAMGLRSAETGDVEAWLSAADSAYKDEFGHSAPLWRVRGPRGTTAILELNELKCCVDTQSPRA